jgi:hypothetical protein
LLTTMYSVMLPRNPPPKKFKQLLDVFRSSQRIDRLIELNLVAGANFALGWIRNWHLRLNYSSIVDGFRVARTRGTTRRTQKIRTQGAERVRS